MSNEDDDGGGDGGDAAIGARVIAAVVRAAVNAVTCAGADARALLVGRRVREHAAAVAEEHVHDGETAPDVGIVADVAGAYAAAAADVVVETNCSQPAGRLHGRPRRRALPCRVDSSL